MIYGRKYNRKLNYKWLKETGRLLEIMKAVIPRSCSNRNEVGLLGSAALALLQEEQLFGPMWGSPGDYDFFVAGRFGRNNTAFDAFVQRCQNRLANLGYAPYGEKNFLAYGRNGLVFWVFDFHIADIGGKISFIQRPDCENTEEVARTFDIDVCRVIYNIHKEKLTCSAAVKKNIKAEVAVVSAINFTEDGLTKERIAEIKVVMERVVKYKERGFKFLNDSGIMFMPPESVRSQIRTRMNTRSHTCAVS